MTISATQRPPGLLWPDYVKAPYANIDRIQRSYLSKTLARTLDRTIVLGDDENYGHTGCVNAVSWAEDGNLLLTAGDDTTVRLWRMDPTSSMADPESDYPFVCKSVIATGHRANIFNVAMLPYSNRIVTVAGDHEVRVVDATTALAVQDGEQTNFSARELSVRVIRCHKQRVKKLVTEDSPDVFLTLSEDGTVRQHDLRMRHNCRNRDCPTPLVEMRDSSGDLVELSNISLSRITPYQFVVAGESPCFSRDLGFLLNHARQGYLFDRRQLKRVMEDQWGSVPRMGEGLTTCVRRFAKPAPSDGESSKRRNEHISGCRMSDTNGHEVLLSYMKDKIYIFSTLDDPLTNDDMGSRETSVVAPNPKSPANSHSPRQKTGHGDEPMMTEENRENDDDNSGDDDDADEEEEVDLEFLLGGHTTQEWLHSGVPIVPPRRAYSGHRSRDTVKDVNFLGPFDEYVVSGSDDGNWFVWEKETGRLHGVYEGDDSVVNVVEGHPHLPLVAVSGIDTTVKLFSPAPGGGSVYSRMHRANEIMQANANHRTGTRLGIPLSRLLIHARQLQAAMGDDDEGETRAVPCTSQ